MEKHDSRKYRGGSRGWSQVEFWRIRVKNMEWVVNIGGGQVEVSRTFFQGNLVFDG